MPNFPTVESAQTWCNQHFPSILPHTPWSFHLPTLSFNWFWIGVAALAYLVGRIGIPTLWSDLKAVESKITGLFSSASTTTTTSASSATA